MFLLRASCAIFALNLSSLKLSLETVSNIYSYIYYLVCRGFVLNGKSVVTAIR